MVALEAGSGTLTSLATSMSSSFLELSCRIRMTFVMFQKAKHTRVWMNLRWPRLIEDIRSWLFRWSGITFF